MMSSDTPTSINRTTMKVVEKQPKKKTKKPRYSREQKRARKSIRLTQQQDGGGERLLEIIDDGHDNVKGRTNAVFTKDSLSKKQKAIPKQLSWYEQVMKCTRQAKCTKSICVEECTPSYSNHLECSRRSQGSDTRSTTFQGEKDKNKIRLVTCSDYDQSLRFVPPCSRITTIRVQPLLILDLNGILCHRIRPHKEPPGVILRKPCGSAAGTPVIRRIDLIPFLQYLQEHFCLAIWTSAKRKTARALLQLLIPYHIQKRFLFVWSQEQCRSVVTKTSKHQHFPKEGSQDLYEFDDTHDQHHHHHEENVIFEKHLTKVWETYPLWNCNNTLLMDDTAEKCVIAKANAIHPVALHGQMVAPSQQQQQQQQDGQYHQQNHINYWQSDEVNENQQRQFFLKYAQFWKDRPFVEYLSATSVPSKSTTKKKKLSKEAAAAAFSSSLLSLSPSSISTDDAVKPITCMTHKELFGFLKQTATISMGWRGEQISSS